MFPSFLELGPFHIRAFGVLLAVSFVAGSGLVVRRGRRRGLDDEFLLNAVWWILISSIVGARLYFVLQHPDSFEGPLEALRIWEGGMVLYGGILAAVAASWIHARRHGVPFLVLADVCAPALALGEGISRIGCHLNGCCFGDVCGQPLGVVYPADAPAAAILGTGVPVHPSPLYLSIGMFLVFAVLTRVERRTLPVGRIFGLYLVLEGVLRYVVDFTRYFEPGDRVPALAPVVQTHSQVVALVLVAAGIVLLLRRSATRWHGFPTRSDDPSPEPVGFHVRPGDETAREVGP